MDKSCACQICGKHFSTVNAYNNHLKSKKHREAAEREDTCPTSDVQQINAKNERKRSDVTHSSKHRQCSSEAVSSASEMGASGGVADEHQLQQDIGTASYCIIIMVCFVSVNIQFYYCYYSFIVVRYICSLLLLMLHIVWSMCLCFGHCSRCH